MLLLLLFMVPVRTQVLVRHPVPVLWMMPLSSGPPWANVTTAVVPAVHLALQDLQRAPPPLGNYELQLQLLDSQVRTATQTWKAGPDNFYCSDFAVLVLVIV